MVNDSKKRSTYWQYKLLDSGAFGKLDPRLDSMQQSRNMWRRKGNLTEPEIDEITELAYGKIDLKEEDKHKTPVLGDQIRRYYLKYKDGGSNNHQRMFEETKRLLEGGVNTLDDLIRLGQCLNQYMGVFVLYHKGMSVTSDTIKYLPQRNSPDK